MGTLAFNSKNNGAKAHRGDAYDTSRVLFSKKTKEREREKKEYENMVENILMN